MIRRPPREPGLDRGPQSDLPSPRATALVTLSLAVMLAGSLVFLARAVSLDAELRRAARGTATAEPSAAPARPATSGGAKRVAISDHENLVAGAFQLGAEPALAVAGFEDGILDTIDAALGGRFPRQDGALVRALAVEETALGRFARYARLEALEYRPPDPGARALRFYAFNGEQSHGYFDAAGKQPVVSGWLSPLDHLRRTSRFDPKRLHPVLHVVMPHNGTDFGAPMGTPVYAAYKGVIDWIGPHGPTGNWIAIVHPNGVETGYAHLSKFAAGLKKGDPVRAHQLIGYVGTTGRSTGPHLHFSARKDGKFFDAETLLARGEREIPAVDRDRFLVAKAELDRRIDGIALPEVAPVPSRPPEAPVDPVTAASSRRAQRRAGTP